MARQRISLPLYVKVRFEDGWSDSPRPGDVIPPPENERRQWFDNPQLSRLNDPRYNFDGFTKSPLAADNDLAFSLQHDTVPAGLDRHIEVTWLQQPLSDPNELAAILASYDVPVGRNPQRNPWEGTQFFLTPEDVFPPPTPAPEFPATVNPRLSQDGFLFSPLPDSVEDPLVQPQYVDRVNQRAPVGGFIFTPLPDSVEDPAIQPVFPDQVNPRISQDGFAAAPLSDDLQVDEAIAAQFFPDQVNARPVSDGYTFMLPQDVEEPLVAPVYTDFVFSKADYGGFIHQPYIESVEDPLVQPNLPDHYYVKPDFGGFLVQPGPDLIVETPLVQPEYPTYMYPAYKENDISFYLGQLGSPLSDDSAVVAAPTIWRPVFMPRRR